MKKIKLGHWLIVWLILSFIGGFLKITHQQFYIAETILAIVIAVSVIILIKLLGKVTVR